MNIRPMEQADLPACARIMAENPLWQRYGVTHVSALHRFTSGFAQAATILVAAKPDGPAGFIWYLENGAFGRSGYIMLVGIDAAHQGQGVGDSLMEAAEQILFQKSGDIFLLVSDFNAGAQRFYHRRGYEQVGALPGYVLPDVTELIFRKKKTIYD